MNDWNDRIEFHSLKVVILLFALLCLFFFSLIIFSLPVKASDSVSDDSAFIKWEKDNVDAIRNGLAGKGTVVNPDFYLVTYDTLNPNFWEILARNYDIDYEVNVGKPLNRQIYDYAVSNNLTNTDIYNDCFNTIYNDLNDFCPYVIYQAMPVSYFLNDLKYAPSLNSQVGWINFKNGLSSLVNSSDSMFLLYFDSWVPVSNYNIISISSNALDNYSFCLYYGQLSNWQNYSYQTYSGFDASLPSDLSFSGLLSLYNDSGIFTGSVGYSRNSFVLTQTSISNVNGYFALGLFNNAQSSGSYTRFEGTPYLVPDSWGSYSFMVFKSYNLLNSFYSGDSFVYQFDPSIDISKYGSDLDLDELYDVISDSVGDAEGNIIDSINSVANNFLKDQVELLGDIKNALNDSFGRSWLRIISGQLDDYFPRTLIKLNDLKEAFLNFSPGGSSGSVDLTQLEDDVAFIKGLLIFQTAHDIIDDLENDNVQSNDFNDVVTVASTKFPFSIPNDIVTILTLFVAEPEEPEFSFPVPFANDNERFDIDISFIGSSLPYIRGAFIILFILFLVVVSVKVINSLKE